MTKKVLVFSGSMRQGAFSKHIATTIKDMCNDQNSRATYIELNDYPLPILNQDDAHFEKFPKPLLELRTLLEEHDAWVICTPEHNGSIPAALKNVIDWSSRPGSEDEPMNRLFKRTPILIVSSSIGPFGGIKASNHLRQILSGMGAEVFPTAKPFMYVNKLLNDQGDFIDNKHHEALKSVVKEFIEDL